MHLLAVIVSRDKLQKVSGVFEKENIHDHYICLGYGTANSEMMDMLGLGSTDKAVVISCRPDFQVQRLLDVLKDALDLKKPGNGIAFTVPISGASVPMLQLFESDPEYIKEKEVDSKMESAMKGEHKFSLIMAIVNQGFTDGVMTAAKAGGARGGTIIHARRAGGSESESFFGISIKEEKEIVLILTTIEKKAEIMKSICQTCGIKSEAHGLVFSLPVEAVEGIEFEKF
jgi:nitrogen regulatory protein PII